MSIDSNGFLVVLEKFAKSHYFKDFTKKPHWDVTWRGIEQILIRFDAKALGSKLEPPIAANDDRSIVLYKMSFRLAKENASPKKSGNRIIFSCDFENSLIRILLIYNKNHVTGKRETDWWQSLVYSEYLGLP